MSINGHSGPRMARVEFSSYWKAATRGLLICLLLGHAVEGFAQQTARTTPSREQLEQRIAAISSALTSTQQQIDQSQRQMQELQKELDELRTQMAGAKGAGLAEPASAGPTSTS